MKLKKFIKEMMEDYGTCTASSEYDICFDGQNSKVRVESINKL